MSTKIIAIILSQFVTVIIGISRDAQIGDLHTNNVLEHCDHEGSVPSFYPFIAHTIG